jgi:phospholipid transport system substrate-binding protein
MRNYLRHRGTLAAALFIVLQFLTPGTSSAADELSPEAQVRQITTDVMDAIKSDKALQAGDRTKALALAEQKILPYVDFREATRLAVGRAWSTATAEQQNRLVDEFRALLVRTYANAVDVYRGQTMKVQPVRMAPGATEVTVRNLYLNASGQTIPVDYSMLKTPEGWKVYDVTVDGMSLVITYRGEFGQIVRQSGIDGLLARLGEKNRPPK